MANAMLTSDEDLKTSNLSLMSFDSTNKASVAAASATTKGSLPARKSVEFAILPPPKRVRPAAVPWTAKLVLDAIATSITHEERLEAIQKARDAFQHDSQSQHDDEISTGVDAALTKHLTFLVYRRCSQHEIALACECIESLYRASSHLVGASFQRMGKDLMDVIVALIEGEIQQRQVVAAAAAGTDDSESRDQRDEKNSSSQDGVSDTIDTAAMNYEHSSHPLTPPHEPSTTADGNQILRMTTKILGHFARVGEATKPIAHCPGLLGCVVKLVTLHPFDCVPWEARLSALWTLANLACNAENMQMMVCSPGLVSALIEVACRPLSPTNSMESTMEVLRSRSIAARAILNLSWAPENKILLAENASLIDLLAELSVNRSAPLNRSRTVQEILSNTRRHSAGALRNLAAAPRRIKIGLCDYKKGHLLDVLTDAALNDNDSAVKDRAFAAIHNLTIQDTAEKIANHPALILALKSVLLSSDEQQEGHADGTPKHHASATLLILEQSITAGMATYKNLRGILDAVNPIQQDSGKTSSVAV